MHLPKWRRALSAAAAASFIGVSLIVTSAPAGAEVSAQDTCDRGEVCVYDDRYGLIDSSEGNLWGTYGPMLAGGTVRNNGTPYAGADHIEYTVVRRDGSSYTRCLHYPGDDTPTSGGVPIGGSVKNIHWVAAC